MDNKQNGEESGLAIVNQKGDNKGVVINGVEIKTENGVIGKLTFANGRLIVDNKELVDGEWKEVSEQ